MNYNAHDIAYEIEGIAEKIFGASFAHSGTIFDRDLIEKEIFYESINRKNRLSFFPESCGESYFRCFSFFCLDYSHAFQLEKRIA